MPVNTFLMQQGAGLPDTRHFRRAARLVALLTGFVIIMLAGGATFAALNERDEAIVSSSRTLAALVHSLAEHAARTLAEADRAMRTVVETLDDPRAGPATTHELLKRLSSELPQVRSMLQLDSSGRAVADAVSQPPRPFVGADRPYFRVQREATTDDLFIGLPIRGALSGQWTIALSRRVLTSNGRFAGVVAAALDLAYFNSFFSTLLEPGGDIAIFRADGRLLVRQPIVESLLGSEIISGADLDALASQGPRPGTGVDGISRIVAVRAVTGQPLFVSASVSLDTALANWRERTRWLAGGTALACLVIGILGWLLSRRLQGLAVQSAAMVQVTGLMDAMLAAIGQGIVITDARDHIMLANRQAADLSGTPPDKMRPGESLKLGAGRGARSAPQVIQLADGRKTAVRRDAMPDGNTVTILTDVTAEKAAEAKLTRLAMLDPLTELPNRRAFLEAAEGEINRVRRHAGRACIAILDIDHFKQVNDRHGHQTGDVLLRTLADLWAEMLRSSDTLARYGGEEFIVLMPETEPGIAIRLLERLRQATSSRHLGAGPDDLRVTVSIGLAALGPDGHVEDAIEAADAALYQAKAEGRNRVRAAPTDPAAHRRQG